MNYEKIYYAIINKAKEENKNGHRQLGYFEKHHIIPKSLGGSNDETNLVKLTAREHFICHALLIRFLKGNDLYKMKWAFHQLCTWSTADKCNHKDKYINSYLYESFKKNFQKGKNNSQYGTKWCHNIITGEVRKYKNLPSDEWKYGRILEEKKQHNIRIKKKSLLVDEFQRRELLIINSNIDLTKYGWIEAVSKKTGLTRRQIYYMVNNSEKLKQICFRRSD